jgi:uncharacterized protein YfaS (alpha-2-macroglobulin family)
MNVEMKMRIKKVERNSLRRNWFVVALILMSGLLSSRAAFSTQSLTLSEPQGRMYSGETIKFKVTGDNLRRIALRVYRLKGTTRVAAGSGARTQVLAQTLSSGAAHSQLVFRVVINAPGWYQAEARADDSKTAFDEVTFSLAKRPARHLPVPTLQLDGPAEVNPPGNATFEARGDLLKSATLRAWKLAPGGAQSQVYEVGKPMPPRPPKTSKKYDEYEPVIRWSAPLKTPGVYLLEATSNRNLKRLKYVRVSDIGLVSKRAPHEILVYAIRLSNGVPIPRAAIRVDDSGVYETRYRKNGEGYQVEIRKPQPSRALSTQGDGVARFYNTPGDGTLKVSASAPDGSRVYGHEAFLQNASSSDLKVLFYTERPIYRPGQTVYFKGVARRDLSHAGKRGPNGALFVPVEGAKIKLELTDAANEKFATLNLKTNGDGAFAGKVLLRADAPVGRYSVETFLRPVGKKTDESFYNRFLVQEYRKPEYEVTLTPQLDAPFAIAGTPVKVLVRAKYFFGTPVRGATLEYSGDESGSVKLDENGEAVITLSNHEPYLDQSQKKLVQNGAYDRTLNLKAKVTDDANRIVESETSILSAYALVRPTMGLDKTVYNVQDTAKVKVRTTDPLGRGVASKATVVFYYTRKSRIFNRQTLRTQDSYQEVEFLRQDVQTDRFGVATFESRLGRAGYLHAVVTATDALGRTSKYDTHFWSLSKVQKRDFYWGEYEFPNIEITPDRTVYQPGETVRALLTTSKESGYALVTLQGDRIFFHRVVKLNGRVNVIEFTYPESAAPGAHLVAGTSQGQQWSQDTAYLKAISPAQTLKIAITTDRDEYRPGTNAQYSILVKDGNGKPQRADVSLGLVDKAIYGLANDETPDPVEFFYGSRENLVSTSWQFPGEVQGGSYQRIEQAVPVRRNFQDTAYWNPFVTTIADGSAKLAVALPDNLTTWRATARAFTADTKAGATTDEILVTKPLLTRLILPRFLTQTDRVRAQVIVQNNLAKSQDVKVSLHGIGVSTFSDLEQKGAQNRSVPAGASASFYWMIGTDEIPIGQRASLVATARTGDLATSEDSDAQELKLPIQPRGFPIKKWATAAVRDDASTLTLKQAPEFIRNASRLKIALAPSVAGPMLSALPNLIQYPYGCTEQTLSRFVPAIAAARAVKSLKIAPPEAARELPKIVEAARSTLYSYQHADGGWGWWPDDDTDPYITAYTVYGLSLAKEAGYDFERPRIQRGLVSIQNQFGRENLEPDARAFMMLAYATAIDVWNFDAVKELGAGALDYPNAVYEFRAKLSPYGLASLALAHERLVSAGYGNAKAVNEEIKVHLTRDAALYYIYKKYQARSVQGRGPGKYFRSMSTGRIYYRDLKTGSFQWVSPPKDGIWVDEKDAAAYSDYIGYNDSDEGSVFGRGAFKDWKNADGIPVTLPKGLQQLSTPAAPKTNPKTETYRAHLETLLDELENKARRENGPNGAVASWPSGDANASGWNDSDVEATALALQVLVRARPQSSLIQPTINWLMQSRRGTQWRSTKDTAQVVIALGEYLENTKELDADETVRVLVNGREVKTLRFNKSDIGKPDVEIILDGFNEDADIQIQRSGRGVVYASAELVSYTPSTLASGADNGFKVSRKYQVQNEKGKWRDISGPIPSGVLVRVDLRVEVSRNYEYVLLEDWMPSGFEARPEDDGQAQLVEKKCDCETDNLVIVDPPPGWNPLPISRREGRDNRQAWFVDSLPYDSNYNNGKYFLRYILRPEQPGTRVAPPARIEAMYRPDFNGHSSETPVEVK